MIRNFFHLDLLFLSRSYCLLLFVLRNLPTNALPLFYFLRKCIKSNRLQTIFVSVYEDTKDLLSARRKIWWENPKKGTKMTRFPAPGFEPWPRTATWCGQMLYPLSCGELVDNSSWILKSCFRRSMHRKDEA